VGLDITEGEKRDGKIRNEIFRLEQQKEEGNEIGNCKERRFAKEGQFEFLFQCGGEPKGGEGDENQPRRAEMFGVSKGRACSNGDLN